MKEEVTGCQARPPAMASSDGRTERRGRGVGLEKRSGQHLPDLAGDAMRPCRWV